MNSLCIEKTSDGKRKTKGKKKPRAIAQSRARLAALKRKLGVN